MNPSILDRILYKKDYQFVSEVPSDLSLSDNVICYTDGIDIKIVPLDIMKKYPILYDMYNNKNPISIIVCPFTLSSCIFEGHLNLTNHVENSSIVLEFNSEKFNIVNGSPTVKRYQVQIKTLRNAFTDHIHAKYFRPKKTNINKISNIVNDTYYSQNNLNSHVFHDKTLVYLILYESSQTHNTKCTVIVGSNASKNHPTGYNIHESKVAEYLENNEEKIHEKLGFIMPILWFAYKPFFNDAKIIIV